MNFHWWSCLAFYAYVYTIHILKGLLDQFEIIYLSFIRVALWILRECSRKSTQILEGQQKIVQALLHSNTIKNTYPVIFDIGMAGIATPRRVQRGARSSTKGRLANSARTWASTQIGRSGRSARSSARYTSSSASSSTTSTHRSHVPTTNHKNNQ